jgi:hypothetical protein
LKCSRKTVNPKESLLPPEGSPFLFSNYTECNMFKPGELVTIQLEETNKASNTYIVVGHLVDGDGDVSDAVVLRHPLHKNCMIVKHIDDLNKVQANLKDSTERSLEFAMKFEDHLDHNTKADLEALRLCFVIHRNLTNGQKNHLSNICGTIASIYYHNDITMAMRSVTENSPVLDSYNMMWFMNFKDLFTGKKPIVSPKQRSSIFNIAGFVLAELESQKTKK